MPNTTFNQPADSPARGVVGEVNKGSKRDSYSRQGPDVRTSLATSVKPADYNALPELIGIAADAAKTTFVGYKGDQYEESLKNIQKLAVADRTNELNPDQPIFSEEEMRVLAKSDKIFRSFSAARDQGALTDTAARIAAESELKRLINQFPGLGPEIRAAAAQGAGFDPTGSQFAFNTRALPAEGATKDTRTDLQKRMDDNVVDSKLLGIPVNIMQANTKEDFLLERQQSLIDKRTGMDSLGTEDVFNTAHITSVQNVNNLQKLIFKSVVTPDGIDVSGLTPDVLTGISATTRQLKNGQVIELRQNLQGRGVDPKVIGTEVARLNKTYDDFQAVVDDASIWEAIRERKEGSDNLMELVVARNWTALKAASTVFPADPARGLDLLRDNPSASGDQRIITDVLASLDPKTRALGLSDPNTRQEVADGFIEQAASIYDGSFFSDPTTSLQGEDKTTALKGGAATTGTSPDLANAETANGKTVGENVIQQLAAAGETSWGVRIILEDPTKAMQVDANKDLVVRTVSDIDGQIASAFSDMVSNGAIKREQLGELSIEFDDEGELHFTSKNNLNNSATPRGLGIVDFGSLEIIAKGSSTRKSDKLKGLNFLSQALNNPEVQRVAGMTPEEFRSKVIEAANNFKSASVGRASQTSPDKLKQYIAKSATDRGIDPEWVNNVFGGEYLYRDGKYQDNQQGSGAVGPFQFTSIGIEEVNRINGTSFTKQDYRDNPQVGADGATTLLQDLYNKVGDDEVLATAAYNGGIAGLKSYRDTGYFKKVSSKNFALTKEEKTAEVEQYVMGITGETLREYVDGLVASGNFPEL